MGLVTIGAFAIGKWGMRDRRINEGRDVFVAAKT